MTLKYKTNEPDAMEDAQPTGASLEESQTGGESPASHPRKSTQEEHRKEQCQGCAELKRVRKELKRLKQDLRASRQLCYAEQQRAQRLQGDLDLSLAEVKELKSKLGTRTTSVSLEGWFDVCVDFKRRTRRRPSKSRGITWQRRYLVARDGRLYMSKRSTTAEDLSSDKATIVVDMDENLTFASPTSDDPEVFLLNRDHQKLIKIIYTKGSQLDSSSASDCSDSTFTDSPTSRVIMLEAPSVEEKTKLVKVLDQERELASMKSRATLAIDDETVELAAGPRQISGGREGKSPSFDDVICDLESQRAYVMRLLKSRNDSETTELSSCTSSQADIDDFEETPKGSENETDDVTSQADDFYHSGSDDRRCSTIAADNPRNQTTLDRTERETSSCLEKVEASTGSQLTEKELHQLPFVALGVSAIFAFGMFVLYTQSSLLCDERER